MPYVDRFDHINAFPPLARLILQKGNLFDKKNRKQYLYKINFFDSNLHIDVFFGIKKIIEFEGRFSFPRYKNSLKMDSQKVFQKKNHNPKYYLAFLQG